ncbi:MAG: trypsin-like peptidase domain-containing protein [Candidatus Dadabacteria bacterium]|nr:trypsin-like peptidase domain-containing protein [Candidatus Dadabacteria bacterium]
MPIVKGMSGGPIFNDRGEVVSIISAIRGGPHFEGILRNRFGVTPFRVPSSPPQNLWVYGFVQPDPNSLSFGPNPAELREVIDKIPDEEKPDNAGEYRSDNKWEKAGHEFGNEYSPFPLDQFDHMQDIYKRAREATVELRVGPNRYGSGFIYDADTVITAGHVAPIKGETVYLTTNDLKIYNGTVFKTQYQAKLYGCDIAVIKTNEPLPPGEHQILEIADDSSLQCGDPLVVIGSADFYNSVGHLQGVGAVYMSTETYISKFISHSSAAGMSGGPVVDKHGRVVSLSSQGVGKAGEWRDPGPFVIRTRLPVYFGQDFFEGPNAETIKRFVDEDEFFCPE